MTLTPTLARIESTVEGIRSRDAAYHPLTERFGPLFIMKERVREASRNAGLLVPDIDEARLTDGVPVLAGLDLASWSEALADAARLLLPVIIETLALAPDNGERLRKLLLAPGKTTKLLRSRLDGGPDRLVDPATAAGITPAAALPFAVDAAGGPVLACLAESVTAKLAGVTWERGFCPVCGCAPSIAQLAQPDSGQSEYLVGGGGKKFLHCSLCGHDWHFSRTACAACGNEDDKARELLFVDGARHERIEACRACGSYMLCVDLREYAARPDPDVLQVGLIHLDILARKQALTPLAYTLWNTLT
ncbi:formate dehydrogenase accessory protein FdhE [Pseudodesulfovibrio thermohalotolerans]|uniref:formate dehydrogenase accessory protein FdhE n=1 Tax=Pseudodesulfovibrio thermohalotolerans TaxID=2880651 RepID=UPI00244240EC|nr:formate dehydrogenase accessory protein FdhE [Pseudodesulfovibrio thermohalotolerans]WFS61397.1 formate dehydrogenase accessory protein FdhE [Pseudodesulfovibrio thermohalotolerans]